MKKLFAILAIFGMMSVGLSSVVFAQDTTPEEQTEQVAETPVETPVETAAPVAVQETSNGGLHQAVKTKFIEGGAGFMSLVAIALILGLAFCLERIIYLSLADVDPDTFLGKVGESLGRGDVEAAKDLARDTRGPIASIVYQGLLRLDQGPDTVERSIVSYGGVQSGLLERNLSWITLFIAIAPSLGFLGTVVGMVMAFDDIQRAGDMSPTIVAGGMKVALITTVGGLIVAIILQIIYNYILSKMEGILNKMEDASITFLDQVIKYNVKYKNL
jgi:biopolymer transport protein ExbB